MREIKFRAWDKERKHWMSSSEIEWSVSKEGAGGVMYIGNLGRNLYDICQFTGLKDNNGKEIYEGDIVKVVNCGCGKEICTSFEKRISQVEWCRASIMPFGNNYDGETYQDSKNYEVIGNIYENPELLK